MTVLTLCTTSVASSTLIRDGHTSLCRRLIFFNVILSGHFLNVEIVEIDCMALSFCIKHR